MTRQQLRIPVVPWPSLSRQDELDKDKPRANTATAHKQARMVYSMLTRGEAYVDQGQQHYEEQQRQRSIAALKRRAAALGFAVMPAAPA